MSERVTSVIVMLTVPEHWQRLPVREIEKKLSKQPHLIPHLAKEVKRWAGSGAIDMAALKRFVDKRTGDA